MAVSAAILVLFALAIAAPSFAYASEGGAEDDVAEVQIDLSQQLPDDAPVFDEQAEDPGEEIDNSEDTFAESTDGEVEAAEEIAGELESETEPGEERALIAVDLKETASVQSDEQPSEPTYLPERDYNPVASIATGDGSELVRKQTIDKNDYIVLPSYADMSALSLLWSDQYLDQLVYTSVSKNGTYSNEVFNATTCATDASGAKLVYIRAREVAATHVLRLLQSSGTRTVYLKSDDPVNEGRAYVEASSDHSAKATGALTLVEADGAVVVQDAELTQIRGRGNSTWALDKKPYQIKLAEKASLLDGASSNKAKTWVLLADAYDESCLRNYVALKTALAAGLTSTPDCEFVDLFYDGEYRGLYLLSEKVQIGGGRVEIDEIENESINGEALDDLPVGVDKNSYGYEFHYVSDAVQSAGSSIKGGYLLELDNATYFRERCYFKTSVGYFVLKSPENATYEQMKYISEYVQAAINAASSANGNAAKYFDMQSLARYFLVNELAKNSDYMRYSSTFFYKDADSGVLHAGPVWDFDLAFGVHVYEGYAEYIDVAGITDPNNTFFVGNKQFVSAVKQVLSNGFLSKAKVWTKSGSGSLLSVAQSISAALSLDEMLWPDAPASVVVVEFGKNAEAISYLNDWIARRIAWMESDLIANLEALSARPDYSPGSAAGVTRLSGADALETMSAIVNAGGFKSKFAILATSEGYWDALTASGVAGLADAPIIMTPTSYLAEQARAQLAKLRPATIIVCGGVKAVSDAVARAASAAAGNARIERCWGNDAVGTAISIYDRAAAITGKKWATTAFICTNDGYWDALSAAPVSYAMHMPIFLTNGASSISAETIAALKKGGIRAVYIVGGTSAISSAVERMIQNSGIEVSSRLGGDTAVETSEAVASYGLNRGMSANLMGVATMNGYWDALSGAAFCGKKHSVIVLVNGPLSHSIRNFMLLNNARVRQAYVFGGVMAVSKQTYEAVKKALSGSLA